MDRSVKERRCEGKNLIASVGYKDIFVHAHKILAKAHEQLCSELCTVKLSPKALLNFKKTNHIAN